MMTLGWKMIIALLLLVNLISFILIGLDKSRARKHQWRIPEKTLFLFALLGGSVGIYLGMLLFRHKTRHWYFKYGIPVMILLELGLAVSILA